LIQQDTKGSQPVFAIMHLNAILPILPAINYDV